jgi:hypothetical protein
MAISVGGKFGVIGSVKGKNGGAIPNQLKWLRQLECYT